MLAEASVIAGDVERSIKYRKRAESYLQAHETEMSSVQVAQMRAALSRATERIDRLRG
jgi:hypothetical protein